MAEYGAQQERDRATAAGQSTNSEAHRCPECGGHIVPDSETTETVCGECGLVVDEPGVDPGPEWRAFTAQERETKTRVGAPMTQLLHDKGLSTQIGRDNTDALGNSIAATKRQQLARLRRWDQRCRTKDSQERNLQHALGEIDRMASALGVPTATRETAGVIYRQALDHDMLRGRSIEGIASAALYAAARLGDIPRSFDEIATVSRVPVLEIQRAYRYLSQELDLDIAPPKPNRYVGRYASALDCTDATERKARAPVEAAMAEGVHSGKDPVGIAASALYAAGQLTDENITQGTIAEETSISKVTIRNRYHEILAAAEDTD